MTDTLSPTDTGDIGAAAKPFIPFIEGLPLEPVGIAKLAELSAGDTMVLEVGVTPAEQPTALVPRSAAPTIYQPEPARAGRYRGRHRRARSARSWAVLGAGALLLAEAAGFLAALAVSW